jgi:hypothetical protein
MAKRTSVNEAEVIIRRLRSEGWSDIEIQAVANSITSRIQPKVKFTDLGDTCGAHVPMQLKLH